jgi:hypothetical protein
MFIILTADFSVASMEAKCPPCGNFKILSEIIVGLKLCCFKNYVARTSPNNTFRKMNTGFSTNRPL